MAIRFGDRERTLSLSVRDLVEEGASGGHLTTAVAQSSRARLAQGRAVHTDEQLRRAEDDADYRAEVRVQRRVAIREWTVLVHGRVDALTEEDGRLVVEEIKSTTLDAGRLYGTTTADWPDWVAQLEIYLWMLADRRPVGRLVLVSLLDGARHVLGVGLDEDRIADRVTRRLEELVEARERRLAWMAERRAATVPVPHEAWRPGQREIAEAVQWGLEVEHRVLVEAPTGLGKTDAALVGVLRYAMATDKVVFWATSRTTQQPQILRALERFAARGLPLRSVAIQAREKACLNDVVACRPDRCAFAEDYYDKLRATGVVQGLAPGISGPDRIRAAAERDRVCPFELALDVSEHVDVVVGDYNYAFDPGAYLRRHFGDASAGQVVVVVDEVHQLVDRARGWGSPSLPLPLVERAVEALAGAGPEYAGFEELARAVGDRVQALLDEPPLRVRDGKALIAPDRDAFTDLAERIDAVALEYAALSLRRPAFPASETDAWIELARTVLRLDAVWSRAGEETVATIDRRRPAFELICLDPSAWLGAWIGRLGGFVGLSATLSPPEFYRDLLGLDAERLDVVRVPSPFPPENRRVLVAPRVSTAYRDRATHAGPTAALLERCIRACDGNVACYFSSFEMLRDLSSRWDLPDREVILQEPEMDEDRRAAVVARLGAGGRPVVLAAVLGGIFAEGLDLPPGALSAVLVAGPGFPPVGLERDLLREHYEARYGEGFRYASVVPGLTRVVQAAGRLIRRPEDRGVIVLVDRRFRWRELRGLLPADWEIAVADDPAEAIRAFQEAGA